MTKRKREIALRALQKQLGSKYCICTIDLEKCLYRDFGNGFNVEISGVNTIKAGKKATLYLWYGTEPPECLIIKTVHDVERTAEAIHSAAEALYKESARLIDHGHNTRNELFGLKYPETRKEKTI